MLIAVPTMACLLTLCVVDSSSSQAFAKGREMGHGPVVKNGRDFGRDFRHFDRHFDRYGWGYGCYGYECPVYETVAPVCTTCEPVVAPVCPTCDPVYVGGNYGFWGYNHFRKDFHNPPRRFQPLSSRGGMGRKG
jgi:hypothetical protein